MLKHLKRQSFFNKIFFYFMLSIICAFLFLIITNTYYIGILQSKTNEQYLTRLHNLSNTIQTTFNEVNKTTALFSDSDELTTILSSNESFKYSNYLYISKSVKTLQNFARTKSFIHNAFIILNHDDLIISNQGTCSIDEFFKYSLIFDSYQKDFWVNLERKNIKYDILPPTYVTRNLDEKKVQVIPTIHYATDNGNYNNILVVCIDNNYIIDLFNQNKLSKNSVLFVYDKSQKLISRSDAGSNIKLNNSELIKLANIKKNSDNPLIIYNGIKYLVVTTTDVSTKNTFCAVMPYSDLLNESFKILLFPLIIFTLGIIIAVILSFFFSRKIYLPIHNATETLRESCKNEIVFKNDLDFLSKSVQNIISDNIKLRQELNLAIPYVCERYLISLFDDNEILKEDEVTEFLSNYDFTFPNNNFIVIQSTLKFKNDFFKTHSKAEYNAVCQSSLYIANEAFSSINHRYVFSVAINQICVILNLPSKEEKSKIAASILKYHKSLDIDEKMMIVHSGVGKIHENLNGLKKSYKESITALSHIAHLNISMIRTYSEADEDISNFYYTIDEENQLMNYLLQGDKEKVFQHINRIIDKNLKEKIGTHALKELYLQLYNTSIRVINKRHLSLYDLMGEDYINITNNINKLNADDLYKYIQLLFNKILAINKKANQEHDITTLKEYLDMHYHEEIYLDSIADYFGKSPKYMSRYIKQTIGISFQDYISKLRINKAKELLITTNKNITEIANEIGFNSRHPFIRKFKILEGVTPTQYRNLNK